MDILDPALEKEAPAVNPFCADAFIQNESISSPFRDQEVRQMKKIVTICAMFLLAFGVTFSQAQAQGKGRQIENRMDRKGDRIDHCLDRRGERLNHAL